jgi:hypothetical protein
MVMSWACAVAAATQQVALAAIVVKAFRIIE